MNIAIPTYKRSNSVKTYLYLESAGLLEHTTLFVANQEEYDLYKITCPNVKIVIGEIGIKNQRNFITNYYEEGDIIISIDDDIQYDIHKNNKSIKDWLIDCIQYLETSSLGLMTFQPTSNSFFCNKGKEFSTGRYLGVGMFHIYKNNKSLLLTCEYTEDYERSIQYLKKYGANIRYGWVYFKTKYWASGGCSEARTRDTYLKNVNYLLYMYPSELSYNIKKSGPMKDLPNIIIRKKSITDNSVLQLLPYTDFDKLYNMLKNIKLELMSKNNNSSRLGFPEYRGGVWGLIKQRCRPTLQLSRWSVKYPEIYEEIQRIGNIICPFEYKSIQMNNNLVCPPHKDKNNKGNSLLISFGSYTGGEIVIEKNTYNAYHLPTIFDGAKLEHWNNKIEGNKYSLVFFS
jgi:hypothetical protein